MHRRKEERMLQLFFTVCENAFAIDAPSTVAAPTMRRRRRKISSAAIITFPAREAQNVRSSFVC
jgi:hypothetical protein